MTTAQPDQIDRKEAFNIGLELADDDPRMGQPFRGPNHWPDLSGFRDTMLAYFDAVHRLGVDLHHAIALDLGLPEDLLRPDAGRASRDAAHAALSRRAIPNPVRSARARIPTMARSPF